MASMIFRSAETLPSVLELDLGFDELAAPAAIQRVDQHP